MFGLLSVILSITLLAVSGCGKRKTANAKPGTKTTDTRSQRKVMVLPFINCSSLKPSRTPQMTRNFAELLTQYSHLSVVESKEGMAPPSGTDSPKYGITTPAKLIEKAEKLGMDALVTGLFNPVVATTKRTGIWPFRKTRTVYEISLIVNVAHVPSRTTLITHMESEKVSVTRGESDNETEYIEKALGEGLPTVLKRQAATVSKTLARDLSGLKGKTEKTEKKTKE
jgi:hypothetical protein